MINNLRFADDIDLLEESCVALQNSVKLLSEAGIDAGLRINIEKTKTMIFGKEDIEQQIEVLNSRIENVKEFVCLSSIELGSGTFRNFHHFQAAGTMMRWFHLITPHIISSHHLITTSSPHH